MRNMCRILVGRPEGKRPLEKCRRMLEEDIKMDEESECERVDWIHVA
jgi:hypothetical protein